MTAPPASSTVPIFEPRGVPLGNSNGGVPTSIVDCREPGATLATNAGEVTRHEEPPGSQNHRLDPVEPV